MPALLADVPAPAKLNLFLHVTGRRADGYHLLQSVFVPIDWTDTLHFERRGDGAIRRHDLAEPLPDEDLVVHAARALQQASGTPQGADISVDKRIPAQAGLGGGSSDAATTLLALNRLWELHWSRERLAPLALALGADVPFFLHPGPAWVEGIGELLRDVELPEAIHATPVAVLKPPQGLSTAQIFGHPALTRDTKPIRIENFSAACAQAGERTPAPFGFGRNDLQNVVAADAPDVRAALAWLSRHAGPARMTGSGSAVFAPVTGDAERLERQATGLPAGWRFRLCRILRTHPLAAW